MDAIQESLNHMMKTFNARMGVFEERQAKKPATSVEGDNLAAEFLSFKEFIISAVKAIQCQIEVLAKQMDQQEMRGRRKFLMIYGICEREKEDTIGSVVDVVKQRLKISNFSAADISKCYRLGRVNAESNKPRAILFKLREEATRHKIWTSKTFLKGSGITVSEFLTKSRHDLFMAVRRHFGVARCWTRDGLIFVIGQDGSRHRISCDDDITNLLEKESKSQQTVPKAPPSTKAATTKKRLAATKK